MELVVLKNVLFAVLSSHTLFRILYLEFCILHSFPKEGSKGCVSFRLPHICPRGPRGTR